MIEQHYKVSVAAKLAGISPDTLIRWLERLGITFARGARGRGKASIFPESVLKRVIQANSVCPGPSNGIKLAEGSRKKIWP